MAKTTPKLSPDVYVPQLVVVADGERLKVWAVSRDGRYYFTTSGCAVSFAQTRLADVDAAQIVDRPDATPELVTAALS